MRGLYVHIPFCRQACRYCDFYFTVSEGQMDRYADALLLEARSRKPGDSLQFASLYLGGGTPSRMRPALLGRLLGSLETILPVDKAGERTMECNPDDLSADYLDFLRRAGFNRLSIGLQSFLDRDLELMRRAHSSREGVDSVLRARSAGFEDINLDVIYGIPGQSPAEWEHNLDRLLKLQPEHISAYHLGFEPGTVFDHWRKKGRIIPVGDKTSQELYAILRRKLGAAGYLHYEISNFALPGKRARHNSLYWSGAEYLGLGPSAHSYLKGLRSWNPPSLKNYQAAMNSGKRFYEEEEAGPREAYHELLLTALRTSDGLYPDLVESIAGPDTRRWFEKQASSFLDNGEMHLQEGVYRIDPEHWLIADYILRELFLERED